MLESGERRDGEVLAEFDIDYRKLGVTDAVLRELTSIVAINRFIRRIFVKGQLSHECNIMALVYIDRLLYSTKMTLTYKNWRHIVLGAYIMASKVWDDLSMINEDFTVVCPMFTLRDINRLELSYLKHLEFHLTVAGGLYAEYYFKLREVFDQYAADSEELASSFPVHPLTKEESVKLQLASQDSETCVKAAMLRQRKTTIPAKAEIADPQFALQV
jgi:hypothetical protein